MLIAIIIATMGLAYGLVSYWIAVRSRRAFQQTLLRASDRAAQDRLRYFTSRPRDPDEHYVEGIGLVIGDITCKLNARSPYIRCAANPSGPCEGCREYESKDYD